MQQLTSDAASGTLSLVRKGTANTLSLLLRPLQLLELRSSSAREASRRDRAAAAVTVRPLTREERSQFEDAVQFASPAIEAALCLDAPEDAPTATDASGRDLALSFRDWFRLRGLLLCARFGACNERWPPWFDWRAMRHWQAWKAQGSLAPTEARRRFVAAVEALPGYALRPESGFGAACWTLVLPSAGCITPAPRSVVNLCGLLLLRFEGPADRTPTLEEAAASRRKRAATLPGRPRASAGTLSVFTGRWRHYATDGIDEYLQKFGVNFLKRKAAMSFTPSPRYHVERGKLCISMATPLGTRVEWLHPYGPPEHDRDPAGHSFAKTVSWEKEKLVSLFRSDEIADVVTRRWIEQTPAGEMLIQETAYGDVRFTRKFLRDDSAS